MAKHCCDKWKEPKPWDHEQGCPWRIVHERSKKTFVENFIGTFIAVWCVKHSAYANDGQDIQVYRASKLAERAWIEMKDRK